MPQPDEKKPDRAKPLSELEFQRLSLKVRREQPLDRAELQRLVETVHALQTAVAALDAVGTSMAELQPLLCVLCLRQGGVQKIPLSEIQRVPAGAFVRIGVDPIHNNFFLTPLRKAGKLEIPLEPFNRIITGEGAT